VPTRFDLSWLSQARRTCRSTATAHPRQKRPRPIVKSALTRPFPANRNTILHAFDALEFGRPGGRASQSRGKLDMVPFDDPTRSDQIRYAYARSRKGRNGRARHRQEGRSLRGRGRHPLRHVRVEAKGPSNQSVGLIDASVDVNAGGWNRMPRRDIGRRRRRGQAARGSGHRVEPWSALDTRLMVPLHAARRAAALAGGWRLPPAADVG